MKLTLRFDPNHLRRWHLRLAERLARRADTQVGVVWHAGGEALPSVVALLFMLERLIYGLAPGDEAEAAVQDFSHYSAVHDADRVIDFTGGATNTRDWRVMFDGVASEAAALGALIHSQTPFVSIVDASGVAVAGGHPGTESGGILTLAFRDVLARTTTLVVAALDGANPKLDTQQDAHQLGSKEVAYFAAKSLARAAARKLYGLCYNAPHWRVGWRHVEGPDVVDLRAHPSTGWRDLLDDRTRFYADPFPIEHEGRKFVFVEDFVHALGYGVISVVEFGMNGPLGAPHPVLDIGTHLSYPFVFERDGEVFMIPETVATKSLDLYRAVAFPGRWEKVATLLSGVEVSDATLFERDGRWWMLACVRDGGAYSDALHVWSAPDFRGPWQPHRRNPVLVDIASARPAGRVVLRDGALIRPFQDCRDGYGSALGLARITRLDDDAFEQRIETVLRPGPLWPGRRLHTLNRAGWLECIDGSATARRF